MTRSILTRPVAACICFGLASPVLAATPATNPPAANQTASTAKPAETCLADLRAFDSQMQKDGYWLSGSGYGYGYPMMGGYGDRYPIGDGLAPTATGYRDVRSGYDIRTLIAAANILARAGEQQQCEDVLATTRGTYKVYLTDLKSGKTPMADVPGWQTRQIAAAQPVTTQGLSFRSDELIESTCAIPRTRFSAASMTS